MTSQNDLLLERGIRGTDVDFILSSWLRSYRLSEVVRPIPKDVYYEEHHRIARRLLEQSDVKMLVSTEDPDTIIACMISQKPWIHYIYTKQQFRRMKLASGLVGDPGSWEGYTHRTLLSQKIRLPQAWVYNPYKGWLR